jgi:hypothetical protein
MLLGADVLASGPTVADSFVALVAADSAGLVLENAAAHQQRMQLLAGAALAVVVTQILAAPSKGQ